VRKNRYKKTFIRQSYTRARWIPPPTTIGDIARDDDDARVKAADTDVDAGTTSTTTTAEEGYRAAGLLNRHQHFMTTRTTSMGFGYA
jgi:hypothetical protein